MSAAISTAAHTPTDAAVVASRAALPASSAVDASADARRLASLKKGLLTWEAMIQRTHKRLPNSEDRKKEPAIGLTTTHSASEASARAEAQTADTHALAACVLKTAAVYVEYAELKKKVAAQAAAAQPSSSTAVLVTKLAVALAPAPVPVAKPPSAATLSARAALARQRAASATLGSSRVVAQRPEHTPLSPAAAASASSAMSAAAAAVPVAPVPPIAALSSLAAPSSIPTALPFCAGPRHVSQQLKRQRPVGGLLARMGSLHGVALAPATAASPSDESMDRYELESTSLFDHAAAAAQQQDRESAPRPTRDDDDEDDDDGEFDHDLDVEAEMMEEEDRAPAPSYAALAPDAFMSRRVAAPSAAPTAAAASSDPFALDEDDEAEADAPAAPARRTRGPNKPRAAAAAPTKRKPAAKRARAASSDEDEQQQNESDVAWESGDSDEFNSSNESAESGSDEDVPITSFASPPAAGSAAAAAAAAPAVPKVKAARKPRSTKPAKEKPVKLRKVVSTNYVRSDAKHKIKNGTGRAGKSAKALRKEKWNKSQGIERWKSKAEWARDRKEAANDALYCDLLTPEQLKLQVHKSALASAAAAAGVQPGNDDGTDDELEGLRSFECAQFGASNVKTKADAILDSLAARGEDLENQSIMALPALTFKPATVSHRGPKVAAMAAPLPDLWSYTPASLRALLKNTFGYADFRPGQLEAIMRVLNCQSNTNAASSAAASAAAAASSSQNVLAIMPTGGGKTAIYHLLSYILPGLTLVVSPLLSLMKDQLEHLPSCLTGAIWSSEQDAKTVLALMSALSRNEIKVLFISPEKLLTQAFQTFLLESVLKRGSASNEMSFGAAGSAAPAIAAVPGISLVVVDEVHCLAEWSHNFRTAYSRLDTVLHNLLNVPRILGLTATATADTTKQVCAHLRISPENIVRAPLRRDNLILSVSQCTHASRFEAIAAVLSAPPFAGLHSLIIYVSYRNVAMALSKYLENHGFPSCAWYHAGLSPKERLSVHSKFMRGKLQIVVATCAFGMGLDKRDIRGVIHANMPKSVESYIQEIGRAGRDGQLAFCHALWDSSDEEISHSLVHSQGVDRHNMHKLLSAVFDEKLRPRFAQAQSFAAAQRQQSMFDEDECILNHRLAYVALDVEHLRTSMEMTEEVAGTILAKLERLHSSSSSAAAGGAGGAWIKLISCVHNTVQIGFHKTPPKVLAHSAPVIRTLLEQNHWIQRGALGTGMGVGFDHERAASEFDAAAVAHAAASSESPDYNSAEFLQLKQQKGFLSLSLVEAAMSLGADVGDVQKQIVALKARGEISVRWEKLAFLVQVCRMPSSGDDDGAAAGECTLDALVDQLLDHLSTQESKSGEKVSIIAEALKIASVPSMRCSAKDAVGRGQRFTREVARFQRIARKLPASASLSLEDAAALAASEDPEDAPPPPEPEFFDLHAVMDAYFQSEDHSAFLGQLVAHRREVMSQAAIAAGGSASAAEEEEEREAKMVRELQAEVAAFVAAHGESFRCGRDVARVMHGLHAPSAAAQSKSARNTSRFQSGAGGGGGSAAAEGNADEPSSLLSPWAGSSIWGRFKSLKFPLVKAICERALQEFVLGSGAREGARNQAAEKRRQAKKQRVEQQAQAMEALKAKSAAAMIARIQPGGAAFPPAASNAASRPTTLSAPASARAAAATAHPSSAASAPIAAADDDLIIAASDDELEE